MGLLGEIIARTYYESQNKPIYALARSEEPSQELGDSTESRVLRAAPNAKAFSVQKHFGGIRTVKCASCGCEVGTRDAGTMGEVV